MKTVDVIRPGSLRTIIGPSGTLKRIIQNKDYFEHRGYLINVYTHDNINGSLYKPMDNSMNQSYIKNGIKKIKAYLRLKAKSMKLLAFIYLYRDYLNVKRLVNYYISLNKTPDILVFHSTTECYLYHKMKTNENSKVVLFFHSDGIPNKMLYSYYPCIKNSIIAKWLMRIHNEAFLSADKCVFIANKGAGAFFTQERPGKDGKIFRVIKFKSMTDERDAEGKLLPDAKRLTHVGKFVRATSIDELPQLINVLKGDMALIGPRPLLPEYLPLYSEEQARRHEVRPGITGWAQCHGRNAISWTEKFKLDVWYVDHCSLLTDLKIIFITIKSVLKREGISSATSITMEKFNGHN